MKNKSRSGVARRPHDATFSREIVRGKKHFFTTPLLLSLLVHSSLSRFDDSSIIDFAGETRFRRSGPKSGARRGPRGPALFLETYTHGRRSANREDARFPVDDYLAVRLYDVFVMRVTILSWRHVRWSLGVAARDNFPFLRQKSRSSATRHNISIPFVRVDFFYPKEKQNMLRFIKICTRLYRNRALRCIITSAKKCPIVDASSSLYCYCFVNGIDICTYD